VLSRKKSIKEKIPMKSKKSNIEKRAKLIIKYRKMKVKKKEVDEENNVIYYLLKNKRPHIKHLKWRGGIVLRSKRIWCS